MLHNVAWWTLTCLPVLGLGMEMGKHGQAKTGTHNAGVYFVAVIIQYALLYWGGWFR